MKKPINFIGRIGIPRAPRLTKAACLRKHRQFRKAVDSGKLSGRARLLAMKHASWYKWKSSTIKKAA